MSNDEVNAILDEENELAEPIDARDCHPMDWAEVTGVADILFYDIYPEAKYFES